MPQINIGSAAQQIGAQTYSYTLQNNGNADIYLSGSPNVSPTTYDYLLDIGGATVWPSGKTLYAVCAAGQTGTLTYIDGTISGQSGTTRISGTVPISGPVTINDPVQIAGTVPISGNVGVLGTVAINGTVPVSGNVGISGPVTVNGGVNITNSTVNVGGSVAVSDTTTEIYNATPVLSANQGTLLLGGYDVSQMAALIITIGTDLTLGQAASYTTNELRVEWVTAAGLILSRDQFRYSITGRLTVKAPAKSAHVNVWIITGANTYSLPVLILGTTKAILRNYHHEFGQTSRDSGFTGAVEGIDNLSSLVFTGVTTTSEGDHLLMSTAGPASLLCNVNANCNVIVETITQHGNVYIGTFPAAGGFSLVTPVIIPETPIRLRVTAINVSVQLGINYVLN